MTLVVTQTLTSNIQKGGALLDDCRRVVEAWDPSTSSEENLERIARENLLAKASRTRTDDVLRRIIVPRFVQPGTHVLPALRGLLPDPRSFVNACYYEAARDDTLLAAFAEEPLWRWWQAGRVGVGVEDVKDWLLDLTGTDKLPVWSDSVRTKAARGLLAALRDFGVLRGATRKEIVAPSMTPKGFAYVAWREHEQGASSRRLATSQVWRRWLLEPDRVLDLFAQAARLGVLQYSSAGSAVRIDWIAASLGEVAGAAA